jgi:hypothetical protein
MTWECMLKPELKYDEVILPALQDYLILLRVVLPDLLWF